MSSILGNEWLLSHILLQQFVYPPRSRETFLFGRIPKNLDVVNTLRHLLIKLEDN